MKLYTANSNDMWPIHEEDAVDRNDVYVRLSEVNKIMFTPTNDQLKVMSEKDTEIELLAELIWDSVNQVDYDPMHPQWSGFIDSIKEKYRNAAAFLIVTNSGK